ncbi:IclR family transcriptional regulator domain-containing protein [Aliigemmobacter aestuarii]|uniref:IclR family transcriptional regulator domain-containing protein n=1 Tax=Aliigemmobacter aestuarii TaxID=1445661 RepID=UPI001FE422AC
MGRVLPTAMPEAEARSILEPGLSPARTPMTLTEPEAVMAELARIRTLGHAIIDREVETGLRSIVVPIVNTRGRMIAALNIGVAAVQSSVADLAPMYLADLQDVQARL